MLQFIRVVCVLVVVSLPLSAIGEESLLKTTPAEDLKSMQGGWEIEDLVVGTTPELSEAGFSKIGGKLVIEGNQLKLNGKATASLANRLSLPEQEEWIGFKERRRLLMLVLPDGRGVLCSYELPVDDEGLHHLTIAYPHTTVCGRSGHTVHLKRLPK